MSEPFNHQNLKSSPAQESRHNSISVDRPIVTQKVLNKVFTPTEYDDRTPTTLFRQTRNYIGNKCKPSKQCGKSYINIFFPFLSWLKLYQIDWLPYDIIAGITVAIMQIPQGMGYALLANLPAIAGLYTSFFPPLAYAFFATSRHLSMGTIAVVSLMTGNVIDRLSMQVASTTMSQSLLGNSTIETISNKATIDPTLAITIATTLAFAVGIIQLISSVLHLGFITSFLSDSFISAYTTSTAILVLTSQIPDVFGLTLKRYVGPLNVVYTYIEILKNLNKTNFVTLSISICSMLTLVIAKEYIDPLYKKNVKKLKLFKTVQIPIPIELIVIIIGTLASHFFNFNAKYKVKIVNTIAQGFQKPALPSFALIPSLIKDAVMIAIVAFTICISLAKTFAKRFKYPLDSNKELGAYGACNLFGSLFACYPCAASLSRTSVYVNAGGKTQLAGLVSCASLLIIILRVGSLFEPLPKACLASIIIVALKNLLLQVKDVYTIGRVTKLEAIVWIVTFMSTILLDVDYGLFFGILVSMIVVIVRQFRPRTTILGQYERSEIYKTVKRYTSVHEIPQIKIFRFESPIIYFNADFFRESVLDAVGIDLKTGLKRDFYENEIDSRFYNLRNVTHIIIDCASINQVDYSGGKIFLQTMKELNDCQYQVYLCNLRYFNYDLLEKLDMDNVCSVTVTATVHDAVHQIQDMLCENNTQVLLPNTQIP